MRVSAATIALVAFGLSACALQIEEPGSIPIPNSEGGTADLHITDGSGLLVSAEGATGAGAAENFEIQQAPGATNTVRVVWIASPCEDSPQLTIEGTSLDDLDITLDRGPVPDDVVCADIGAVHGVDLMFEGDVSPEHIEGRMVGQ